MIVDEERIDEDENPARGWIIGGGLGIVLWVLILAVIFR